MAVLEGTPGDDDLIGDATGNDVIDGKAGNDHINGRGGDDVLKGGRGADSVYGGSGRDDVRGGAGTDYLDGGPGADILDGGNGSDTLVGGLGADIFVFSGTSTHLCWETIVDFSDGIDRIRFDVDGLSSFDDLDIGTDIYGTYIAWSNTYLYINVSEASLDASDFIF